MGGKQLGFTDDELITAKKRTKLETLRAVDLRIHMSGKGCCWDIAVVENFFSTLKHELPQFD